MRKLGFLVIPVFFLLVLAGVGIHYQTVYVPPHTELSSNNSANNNYEHYIIQIDHILYTNKNYNKALNLIDDKLNKSTSLDDVKKANLLFRKAEILINSEKQDAATEVLKQALSLKLNPDQRIYSYSQLAGICSSDNEKQEALSYIWEADKIIPDLKSGDDFFGSFEFHYHKGTLMLDMGNFKEASDNFRTALKLQPQNDQIMIELAFSLYRSGQVKEAREVAAGWIKSKENIGDIKDKTDRDEMDASEDMARYLLITGDLDKALEVVEKAHTGSDAGCNMDPERACIYYYGERYDEAEVVLNRIINNPHSDNWERAIAGNMLTEINRERTLYQSKRVLTRKKSRIRGMLIRDNLKIIEIDLICFNMGVIA